MLRDWWPPRRARSAPLRARLYLKPDCGLCEEALTLLRPFEHERRILLERVDITADRALFQRYCLSIPVLEVGGGPRLEWPFTRSDLRRVLA